MKALIKKPLLWIIPYFYLVSFLYYRGFWGTFDIDIFHYYELSDIVKNVVVPVSTPLAYLLSWVFLIIGYFAAIGVFILVAKDWFGWFIKLLVILFITIEFYEVYSDITDYFAEYRAHMIVTSIPHSLPKYLIIVPLLFVALWAVHEYDKVKRGYDTLIMFSLLFMGALLIESFYTGEIVALRIKQNIEFDYIVADETVIPQGIYKYLSKAGGYYLFVTHDNVKRVVVFTDKMPLIIEHFLATDTSSVRRFKVHRTELAALAQKQPPK